VIWGLGTGSAQRWFDKLTNHGSTGSPTVVRQAHQPPRVKKEGQSPLLFSQHAAFSIVWFSFREGGRTAVHP